MTDAAVASQRVCMCLKKGLSVCTCVFVETIYRDDVNSESNCRFNLDLSCISEFKTQYLFIALFIDFLYCWIIYGHGDNLHGKTCSDPEVLNTTANCFIQRCISDKKRKGSSSSSRSQAMMAILCVPCVSM